MITKEQPGLTLSDGNEISQGLRELQNIREEKNISLGEESRVRLLVTLAPVELDPFSFYHTPEPPFPPTHLQKAARMQHQLRMWLGGERFP